MAYQSDVTRGSGSNPTFVPSIPPQLAQAAAPPVPAVGHSAPFVIPVGQSDEVSQVTQAVNDVNLVTSTGPPMASSEPPVHVGGSQVATSRMPQPNAVMQERADEV